MNLPTCPKVMAYVSGASSTVILTIKDAPPCFLNIAESYQERMRSTIEFLLLCFALRIQILYCLSVCNMPLIQFGVVLDSNRCFLLGVIAGDSLDNF